MMDGQTTAALAGDIVAVGVAGIAIWQARSARVQAGAAKEQAAAARDQVEVMRQQLEIALEDRDRQESPVIELKSLGYVGRQCDFTMTVTSSPGRLYAEVTDICVRQKTATGEHSSNLASDRKPHEAMPGAQITFPVDLSVLETKCRSISRSHVLNVTDAVDHG